MAFTLLSLGLFLPLLSKKIMPSIVTGNLLLLTSFLPSGGLHSVRAAQNPFSPLQINKKSNGHWTLPHPIHHRVARWSDPNRKRVVNAGTTLEVELPTV